MALAKQHLTHGHTVGGNTPTYNTWVALRRRCTEEAHHHYPEYGGRGINYDTRWDDFENFLADMGPRPEGTTLDRMDPDGNYTAENCRWATAREQVNNLRTNVVLTIGPLSLSISDWAELVGIPRSAIYPRIARGWSHVDAVCKPIDTRRCRRKSPS